MTLSVLIMPSADKLPIVRQPFHKPPSESRRVTRDTSQWRHEERRDSRPYTAIVICVSHQCMVMQQPDRSIQLKPKREKKEFLGLEGCSGIQSNQDVPVFLRRPILGVLLARGNGPRNCPQGGVSIEI